MEGLVFSSSPWCHQLREDHLTKNVKHALNSLSDVFVTHLTFVLHQCIVQNACHV